MRETKPYHRRALVRYAGTLPYLEAGILETSNVCLFKDVKIPVAFRGSMMRLFERQETETGRVMTERAIDRFIDAAAPEIPFIPTKFTPTQNKDGSWVVHAHPNFDTVCMLGEQARLFRKFTHFNGHVANTAALGTAATESLALDMTSTLSDLYVSPQATPMLVFGKIQPET